MPTYLCLNSDGSMMIRALPRLARYRNRLSDGRRYTLLADMLIEDGVHVDTDPIRDRLNEMRDHLEDVLSLLKPPADDDALTEPEHVIGVPLGDGAMAGAPISEILGVTPAPPDVGPRLHCSRCSYYLPCRCMMELWGHPVDPYHGPELPSPPSWYERLMYDE